MKSTDVGIFYNYILLDTTRPGIFDYGRGLVFKFEPFYVGKGKGGRSGMHFRPSSLKNGSAKNKRIKRIKRQTGEWPLIILKKRDVDECTAFRCEYKLIDKIGRKDRDTGPLLNRCSGGAGTSGRTDLPESKLRRVATFAATLSLTPMRVLKKRWANISAAHQSRTDEECGAFYAKCMASNRSHETEVRARMSRSGKARVAQETDKQRKSRSTALSKSHLTYWANTTEEERAVRSASLVEAHRAQSPKKKARTANKISASIAQVHQERTPAQRKAIADKIAQTLRDKSPSDKQRISAGNAMRGLFRRLSIALDHPVLRPKCDRLISTWPWDGHEATRTKFLSRLERTLA